MPSLRRSPPLGAALIVAFVVGCGPAPRGSVIAVGSPPASAGASPPAAADVIRIELPGHGPLGLDVLDGRAYVVTHDSAELVTVDLASRSATATNAGDSATRVVALGEDRVALSRIAADGARAPLEVIDLGTGGVIALEAGPIDALNPADRGQLWAFEKAGAIVLADPAATGRVIGRVTIEIAPNEHIDVVGAAGSAFASSDSSEIRRIDVDPLRLGATITTSGGVPFAEDRGLVWGARPVEVWAIDPATNTVTRRIPLADVIEVLAMDVDGEDAWIAVRHPGRVGAVLRVNLATGSVLADHPVQLPAAVEIAGDRVWVTDYETDTLLGFAR